MKAALAAKAKKAEQEAEAAKPQVFDEQLEAKLAAMDPEKAAKGAPPWRAQGKAADMDPEKVRSRAGALHERGEAGVPARRWPANAIKASELRPGQACPARPRARGEGARSA